MANICTLDYRRANGLRSLSRFVRGPHVQLHLAHVLQLARHERVHSISDRVTDEKAVLEGRRGRQRHTPATARVVPRGRRLAALEVGKERRVARRLDATVALGRVVRMAAVGAHVAVDLGAVEPAATTRRRVP